MDYTIKHVTTEQELDNAIEFSRRTFGEHHTGLGSRESQKKSMLKHMERDNDLLLYAECNGEVMGMVFGYIGENKNMTVGIVAVDERLQSCGIAREMMMMLEKRAMSKGVVVIGLGAVQTAEGFYAKIGYTGSLLIQSKKHSIEELLSLNTAYPVNYTRVHEGTINQVNLALTEPDRDLQRKYETTLPGCYTQMMFWKKLQEVQA
jgi:predicted N-acetyltransferase YhbS